MRGIPRVRACIGLLSGGVMALIALSFVLIFKGTGVVNFARRRSHDARRLHLTTRRGHVRPRALAGVVIALAVISVLATASSARCCGRCQGQPAVRADGDDRHRQHHPWQRRAIWGGDTYSPPTLLPRTPGELGEI
jgi:branched-chain amino acid transport system permease protein